MEDMFIGFVFGVILTVGATILIYHQWKDVGREQCAQVHNVYDCKYVGQWEPAPRQD